MKTIEAICKAHITKTYFVNGMLIGVFNHRGVVLWYKWLGLAGYSLIGETATTEGAEERKLEKVR